MKEPGADDVHLQWAKIRETNSTILTRATPFYVH